MSDGEYRFYRLEEWVRDLEYSIDELRKRLESLEAWVRDVEDEVLILKEFLRKKGLLR